MNKALKFGLISGGVIAILWFLKYKIATPAQITDDGGGEESEGGGGGIGGGGPVDLNGLNHMANNLPNNQTSSTSAGPSSTEAVFQLPTSTPTTPSIGLNAQPGGLLPSRRQSLAGSSSTISAQFGFNGKKTFGFVDDERKLNIF